MRKPRIENQDLVDRRHTHTTELYVLDKEWELRVKIALADGKDHSQILTEINAFVKEQNAMRAILYRDVNMEQLVAFITEIIPPAKPQYPLHKVLQVEKLTNSYGNTMKVSLPFVGILMTAEDARHQKALDRKESFHPKYNIAFV